MITQDQMAVNKLVSIRSYCNWMMNESTQVKEILNPLIYSFHDYDFSEAYDNADKWGAIWRMLARAGGAL